MPSGGSSVGSRRSFSRTETIYNDDDDGDINLKYNTTRFIRIRLKTCAHYTSVVCTKEIGTERIGCKLLRDAILLRCGYGGRRLKLRRKTRHARGCGSYTEHPSPSTLIGYRAFSF